MAGGPEPVDLWDTVLDEARCEALLSDYERVARVLDVLVKGAPTARADPRPVALRSAVEALRAGAVRGVQIRYLHEGGEWRDTWMPAQDGVRVVRIRLA